MSACLYIVVEGEDPGFDIFVNGHALARNECALEQVAEQLGVPPLLEFFSADEESLALLVEQDSRAPAPEPVCYAPRWFAGGDGLLTVRALLSYFEENRMALGLETDAVRLELREYERVLATTATRGLRWRLSVSWL